MTSMSVSSLMENTQMSSVDLADCKCLINRTRFVSWWLKLHVGPYRHSCRTACSDTKIVKQ
jgi:hypothetical protein